MFQGQGSGATADGSKVHFSENQDNSEIGIIPEAPDRIVVHLGFLQILHNYEIQLTIKDELYEDLESDPLQNLFCRIQDVSPSEDGEGHDLTISLQAHKESLVKEVLTLKEPEGKGSGRSLTLILKARVLGKGKGTPSLKNGIRLVGVEVDEDSEQSDWAGFQ